MKLALGFVLAIGMTAPSLAKTSDVWESYCISTKEAVGEQVIKMDVALDKKKWNEYLAQQGSKGWEPVQFLYVPDRAATPIMAACFKRVRRS